MSILLDTNILTRLAQPSHPHHPVASAAVLSLQQRREDLRAVPQNLYEFWVVATRPVAANGGLGMPAPAAKAMLDHFEALFAPLADPPDLYARWKALVTTHATSGKAGHDERLVAAMQAHGIDHILTFNGGDFSRYPGVTPLDPATIVAGISGPT